MLLSLFSSPWFSVAIIAVSYIGIAAGEIPRLRTNRTVIALLGVGLLLLFQKLKMEQLSAYIDIDTIVLLFSMMILNANLRLSGFFQLAANQVLKYSRSPRALLAATVLLSAVLSAIFLNDTICIILTPFIIDLTRNLKRDPIPYLIALATAANIGSTATLTGNPQNMIIGVASGISYLKFASALAPISFISSIGVWGVLVLFYPQEFKKEVFTQPVQRKIRIYKPLLLKSTLVILLLLTMFLSGVSIALAAFLAACLLLITRRLKPEKVFAEFDWGLLVFFSALFILTGVLNNTGVIRDLFQQYNLGENINLISLSTGSIVLSNIVSNVPAVLLIKPFIAQLANPIPAWLTLASSATLAGNLTLLGSVANLIVAESARHRNITLSFWEYTRAGILITIFSLVVHFLWIHYFIW
ncbi:MAG: anion transporter [Chloroflexi bacterium HGW-Chloroflexi-10]|nr:MAG: anion transporter [Chloroflexi bacterium HGW-Chloroflexi-10]